MHAEDVELYRIEGNRFISPFFGFSLEIPVGWIIDPRNPPAAKIAYYRVSLVVEETMIEGRSFSGEKLIIYIFPEQEYKAFLKDKERLKEDYPERYNGPFGEAFLSQNGYDEILFQINRLFFIINILTDKKKYRKQAEDIIQSMDFFPPQADAVPYKLKQFKYLHQKKVVKTKSHSDPDFVERELRGRLEGAEEGAREGNLGILRGMTITDYTEIAVCRLYLGKPLRAQHAFAKASSACEKVHWYDRAVGYALMAGEWKKAREIASSFDPEKQGEDNTLWAHSEAIVYLAGEREEEAASAIERSSGEPEYALYYPSLPDALDSILYKKQEPFSSALKEIIAKHHRASCVWNSDIRNSTSKSFICPTAVQLAILAGWYGLKIPEKIPHRRATLRRLLAFGSVKYDEELHGTKFDLEVDYLPEALLKPQNAAEKSPGEFGG